MSDDNIQKKDENTAADVMNSEHEKVEQSNDRQIGVAGLSIMRLQPNDESACQAWDAYVAASTKGTICHSTGWMRVIKKTFGHTPYYLFAQRGEQLCGVLPLMLVRSPIFGTMLVSNAFAVYGGAVGEDSDVERSLVEKAVDIGLHLGVDYVEFRNRDNGPVLPGIKGGNIYVTFRQHLYPDPQENFSAMPREARRLVRRAKERGLRAEFVRHRLREFYNIYSASVHRLGTPVFPKRLFENFLMEFRESSDILCVWLGNRIIAAVLTFYYRDVVMPYYGGSLREYNNNKIAPNNFMYWSLIEKGSRLGFKWFDFGRSKVDTGAYHFKRHFGMKPEPLNYQYALLRITELPDLNPMNPRYRFLIAAWKRLPLVVSRAIGPKIVANIP